MNKSHRSSRRDFLKAGALAAGVFTIVPRHVLGGRGYVAPSDKVNIALVGAGGQGRTNVRELFKLDDAQVIALADPACWALDLKEPLRVEAHGGGPADAEIGPPALFRF